MLAVYDIAHSLQLGVYNYLLIIDKAHHEVKMSYVFHSSYMSIIYQDASSLYIRKSHPIFFISIFIISVLLYLSLSSGLKQYYII
jgi:hypothetical protein